MRLTGILMLAALATACDTQYEFEDVTIGDDQTGRAPRAKSNSQFVRSVYADLIGRAPELYDLVIRFNGAEALRLPLDEQQLLVNALDAVGDPTPLRNLIVAGLVHHAEASLPDKVEVDDPEQFIRDQFRRFLGREPNAYELRAFADEWAADPKVNPRTVVRALIASREYQSQ